MTESRAARLARELKFPPDLFAPADPRPDSWPDNPDLRRAVDWFKSFIPPQQWVQRREQAARRLYLSAMGIGNEGEPRRWLIDLCSRAPNRVPHAHREA